MTNAVLLTVSILEETRKQLPSKKQKRVDWLLFNKWEREAEQWAEQQKQQRKSAKEPAALNAVQTTKQNLEEEDMDIACASHCTHPYRLLTDQSVQVAATEEAKVPSALINDKEKSQSGILMRNITRSKARLGSREALNLLVLQFSWRRRAHMGGVNLELRTLGT